MMVQIAATERLGSTNRASTTVDMGFECRDHDLTCFIVNKETKFTVRKLLGKLAFFL